MDRIADWRPVETSGPDGKADGGAAPSSAEGPVSWRVVAIGALLLAALAGTALALSAATPPSGFALGPADSEPPSSVPAGSDAPQRIETEPDLVVDVGGAVERPGLYRLAPGSRLGDAIDAAGGYSAAVDLDAAARQLNLAERLADGAKVHVPRRGEQAAPPSAGSPAAHPSNGAPSGGSGAGLIDINSAGQAELETLPGIGPVTAAKIIAARDEAPFASVDDLLDRRVVGPATFEKIRALVTAGP